MTKTNKLPGFDDCVDLYLIAYERYGTDRFTAEQFGSKRSRENLNRLLDLAVAYGLLASDGTTYTIKCGPHEPTRRWETVMMERADRFRQAISDQVDKDTDTCTCGSEEAAVLTYDGRSFTSAFVADSYDFEQTVETVANVVDDTHDGVVLRSAAEYANEIQRFADRLSNPSKIAEMPLSKPLQKEHAAVSGADMDELEFRLFLITT